ncbi:programmed cell death protein 7-like isoform X1 [Hippocampus zosterae]|uniref:programmed cell death protein 7-like isoform X1 n=1 Tax=Hippocampus zosterae TaxID=109293 RepID=UPI00223D09B5|nr:programmed cell death protein 7-like isoform X1 [Hippocampus zosterae]
MDWTYGSGVPGNHPNPGNYPTGGSMPSNYGYEIPSSHLPPGFPCAFPPPQPPPLGYFPNIPPPLPTYPPVVQNYHWHPPNTDFQAPSEICPESPVDEKTLQRKQDEQWLSHFLKRRSSETKEDAQTKQPQSNPDFGDVLSDAAGLVSRMSEFCQNLTNNLNEDGAAWATTYEAAMRLKQDLQDKLSCLADGLEAKKRHVARVQERRLKSRQKAELFRAEREMRRAEKESAVDKWRLRQIHRAEEEKKERELKLAADSVLCEVRKKQSDIKRMQDVLRSLEKLRRLRKDAASRRGVSTGGDEDVAFQRQLDGLRRVIKARTHIYTAEEKALTVMLDSVQEEERRALRKDRERRQKHKMDTMLFGEETPVADALRPFTEYYSLAESSLHALLHVRQQWDVFLVPDDHCDGTTIPTDWILPQPPSDPAWGVALVE